MTTAASTSTQDPFFSDEYRQDPKAVIAAIRPTDPVHYLEPLDSWIVLRYDLAFPLYTDLNVTNDPMAWQHAQTGGDSELAKFSELSLFSAPPKQHARMRGLVAKAFTPRAVARMEEQVVDVIGQFAAPLQGRTGTVDLYDEFYEPIPNTVVSRITGVPAKGDDERRFRELGRASLALINPFLDDAERQKGLDAVFEIRDWVKHMVAERRANPTDDLISDLAQAYEADDQLTGEEIASVVSALIAAGTDTTVSGGVFGLRALLHHTAVLERLRADRSLLPRAVDELLRFDFGPTDWLPRYAVNDFDLDGNQIRKGQLIMLSWTGMHRDPAVFPNPDVLDIDRDLTHLSIFGHGPHYCVGANLARQELRCMLDAVLDFLPTGSKLLDDEIRWDEGIGPLFRGLESLPVRFG